MTNSSDDFNDDESLEFWRANRERFERRATESYHRIRRSIGDGNPD